MTFNIWVGGEEGGQPIEQTVEVIRAAGADIVGMQESIAHRDNGEYVDNAATIAGQLGWNYVRQNGGRAILSRFEIVGLTPDRQGAELKLSSGNSFYLFNIHFSPSPYQPYQLLKIPYGDAPFLETAEELIEAANQARGKEVERVLAEIEPLMSAGHALALMGDFNEPSHLDWTHRAVRKNLIPVEVPYPATSAVTALGLVDAFRFIHPDELRNRGLTWTPITSEDDPADKHDRIDMIFVSPNIRINDSKIIGEQERYADIVVTPYPSDHRAVVAEILIGKSAD